MTVTAPTIRFDIFMAGDLAQAKQVCREFCFDVGLCVTVEPVEYIYTGGQEAGFRIGLINYPRFPTTQDALWSRASELAEILMLRLRQHSYSLVGPDLTHWISRRPADAACTVSSQGQEPLPSSPSRPPRECETCGGLGRIPHQSGGYGINCPSCTVTLQERS